MTQSSPRTQTTGRMNRLVDGCRPINTHTRGQSRSRCIQQLHWFLSANTTRTFGFFNASADLVTIIPRPLSRNRKKTNVCVCGSVRRRCVGTECGGEYSGSRPTISPSDSAVRQKCQTNAQNRNYYQTLGGQTQVTLDTKKIASINKSLQRLTIWK